MRLRNQNERILSIAEDVLIKECNSVEKKVGLVALVQMCRYELNWHTHIHSDQALALVWGRLPKLEQVQVGEASFDGIQESVVAMMVNEWMYRSAPLLVNSSFWTWLAESICWTSQGQALPKALREFSPKSEDVTERLKKNPWAAFLFLLGMSNGISLIEHHQPHGAPDVKTKSSSIPRPGA